MQFLIQAVAWPSSSQFGESYSFPSIHPMTAKLCQGERSQLVIVEYPLPGYKICRSPELNIFCTRIMFHSTPSRCSREELQKPRIPTPRYTRPARPLHLSDVGRDLPPWWDECFSNIKILNRQVLQFSSHKCDNALRAAPLSAH